MPLPLWGGGGEVYYEFELKNIFLSSFERIATSVILTI